jgi:predicted transcriptional regulator
MSKTLPHISEIRELRVKLRVSQRKLAKELGVNQSTIAKIENGKIRPSYEAVSRIFDYLGTFHEMNMGVIQDIQVSPVVYVGNRERLGKAIQIMQRHGFKQLPIKDGELVTGSLSERSVSRQLLRVKRPNDLLRRQVSSFREEPFPIVPEATPVPWVIPLLQHAQAVLTSSGGKVRGIVTNADLIKIISKK